MTLPSFLSWMLNWVMIFLQLHPLQPYSLPRFFCEVRFINSSLGSQCPAAWIGSKRISDKIFRGISNQTAVIPSKICIGGTGFYPSALFIVSRQRVYTFKVLTNSTNRQNFERWGWVLHNFCKLVCGISPLLPSQAMWMGPVFKLSPRFPFAVFNVTSESMRGPMNRQLSLHTYVFASLFTKNVVPSESNNNRVRLTNSVVVRTVQLPVIMLTVLWRYFIILNAHWITK